MRGGSDANSALGSQVICLATRSAVPAVIGLAAAASVMLTSLSQFAYEFKPSQPPYGATPTQPAYGATTTNGCTLGAPTCYVDDAQRILNAKKYSNEPINREYCAQLCSDGGFALSGVENGAECYCGNALRADAKVASATDCHASGIHCSDKTKAEKCGGVWRLDVFNFSCSGTPVPKPTTPPMINNPCANASSIYAKQPWCDATLPIDVRVDDMVGRMTLAEKIGNLNTNAVPIPSLGLNAYNWWSEATHGISHVRNDATTPYDRTRLGRGASHAPPHTSPPAPPTTGTRPTSPSRSRRRCRSTARSGAPPAARSVARRARS